MNENLVQLENSRTFSGYKLTSLYFRDNTKKNDIRAADLSSKVCSVKCEDSRVRSFCTILRVCVCTRTRTTSELF